MYYGIVKTVDSFILFFVFISRFIQVEDGFRNKETGRTRE